MADTGFLPKEKLKDFLDILAKDSVVYVPAIEKDTVIFQPFKQGVDIYLDRPANLGLKSVIYPQCETLLSFEFKKKDPQDPKKVDVEVRANTNFPETVVFGNRPCDAAGLSIYDRVFIDTDTADPYYKERREKTTIVSLSCKTPFSGCFCGSVGGGPADAAGSDIIMTEVETGFFLEAVTEKGKAILSNSALLDGKAYEEKAEKIKTEAIKKLINRFNINEKISAELFALDGFWQKTIDKCLSCGACTYLCPTCYCFNITDEQSHSKGERVRTWDACMFNHFTLETSGHNPRPTRYQRFKNRVGHKFSYYPEKYKGAIACTGCGRCIRYCPVSVDISQIVGYLKDPGQKPENWKIAEKDGKSGK